LTFACCADGDTDVFVSQSQRAVNTRNACGRKDRRVNCAEQVIVVVALSDCISEVRAR
jgi:hypothetical protein